MLPGPETYPPRLLLGWNKETVLGTQELDQRPLRWALGPAWEHPRSLTLLPNMSPELEASSCPSPRGKRIFPTHLVIETDSHYTSLSKRVRLTVT